MIKNVEDNGGGAKDGSNGGRKLALGTMEYKRMSQRQSWNCHNITNQ